MEFSIDYTVLDQYFSRSPFWTMWFIFISGGWIPFSIYLFYLLKYVWVLSRQAKFVAKWSFVVLAIDVPKQNEQTLKAVESIFVALSGTRTSGDFVDKYWTGKVQESFSWEIACNEGYIQFYVRTVTHFRDVVEAAVYAQYPDADIREVPDYTENSPDRFPAEEYDMWGSDIILTNNDAFPIKTYYLFEDQMSGDLKDPMANFLEGLSRIGRGEHFWFQIIIIPTDTSWTKNSEKQYKKLIGAKVKTKKRWIDYVSDFPIKVLGTAHGIIFGSGEVPKKEEKKGDLSQMQFLSPGERLVVEGIQKKMMKVGFKCKIRLVYLAKKEVYNGAKAVSGFFGAMSQYSSLDTNSFKPHARFRTIKYRLFTKRKLITYQNKLLRAFKSRDSGGGGNPYLLNVEELATIYHFPVLTVKAQGVRKMQSKRAEAPAVLPIFLDSDEVVLQPEIDESPQSKNKENEISSEQIILGNQKVFSEKESQVTEPDIKLLDMKTKLDKIIVDETELEESDVSDDDSDEDETGHVPPNLPI